MKSNFKILVLGVTLMSTHQVSAIFDENANAEYEWIDKKDVIITESGVYLDTPSGATQLEIQDFNEEMDQFLVKPSV